MDVMNLYEIAKEAVVKSKAAVPSYADEEGIEMAVFVDGEGKSYCAMTSVTYSKGVVSKIPADVVAYMLMKSQGVTVAKCLIVLTMADRRIMPPSPQVLDMLFAESFENDNCIVVLSAYDQKHVSELRVKSEGMMDGFAPEPEAEPEPAPEPEKAEEKKPEPPKPEENKPEPEPEKPAEEKAAEPEPAEPEPVKAPKPAPVPKLAEAAKAAEKREEAAEWRPAPKKEIEHASNVISGVKIDKSNPFYEAPAEVRPPVETIATIGAEEEEPEDDNEELPALSKEELLKQAKKRKKVARANFLFRKKQE